ncbi:hypothetical protein A8709_13165 [Paenibacillus pectinilyticus]|uniref:beta-fructofuranosidase n=1 Tax=Paenibacillus pectinilyticus TaxID=512399 RepID=A0A1C1A3K7_9BACL|nr:hypothetical protein [Paenibacillus pectinilyticus]OCT15060.1 hypothetical protein A8709_13165 [Paenibacillus pectinilyticus]
MTEEKLARQKLYLHEGIQGVNWGPVKEATLCLKIPGKLEGDLFSVINDSEQTIIRISSGNLLGSQDQTLAVEILMDAKEIPLVLSVGWDILKNIEHRMIIRYDSACIELWVDGALIDEEWPMGKLQVSQTKVHVRGERTEAIFWDYAVSDTEMKEIFELEYDVEKKKHEFLGKAPSSIQYWKPPGLNTSVGDCMPYYDGERFHIYYLFDRRGHRSKWGLGAHQWAHISTRNFKEWEFHPLAIKITEDWEGSICTGSVIQANHRYYAYYAVRAVDGSPARMTWSESTDGIHFEKTGMYIELSDAYHLPSVRDPHVFRDQDGLYRMLITTSIKSGTTMHGCLAQLVSHDLKNWSEESPFIVPGYHDQPECADYFEWNGWYYLLFSNDGNARYRYSRSPQGPWLRPAADLIDGIQLRVPKSAGYTDGRRMAVGFLSTPDQYGGELIIRELVQHADGLLGTKFVEELTERTNSSLHLASSRTEQTEQSSISLENVNGFSEVVMGNIKGEYELSFEVIPQDATMYYGISVADSEDFEKGFDIRFEPSAHKVGIHEIQGVSFKEDEVTSIYQVTGLHDNVVRVKVVMKKGFVDLCINEERTMISRLNHHSWLRFFCQFGAATFKGICIRALTE